MNLESIKSGITNIIAGINEGLILSGYSRTAFELRKLSDDQLHELGISKKLLAMGVTAYPWREETSAQEISDNLRNIKPIQAEEIDLIDSQAPKAA